MPNRWTGNRFPLIPDGMSFWHIDYDGDGLWGLYHLELEANLPSRVSTEILHYDPTMLIRYWNQRIMHLERSELTVCEPALMCLAPA